MPLPNGDLTGTFHNSVAHNDFADRVHDDLTGAGILDGIHMAVDGGVNIGILKGQVGTLHGAVHQLQILAVTQGLRAADLTVTRVSPSENQPKYSPFTTLS